MDIMKNMKRSKLLILLAICISFLLLLSGCGEEKKYLQAKELLESGEYEQAASIFESIVDYEDSKDLLEKCQYEMSADGSFLRALSRGLSRRWYLRTGYDLYEGTNIKTITVGGEEVKPSDNPNLETIILSEYEEIAEYENATFNSNELGKLAQSYIGIVKSSYGKRCQDKNYTQEAEDYIGRTDIIETLVNDYGLVIDEYYLSTYDDILNQRDKYKKLLETDQQISQMMAETFTLSISPRRSYSYYYLDYTWTMKNTLPYDISDFTFKLVYYDANGARTDKTTYGATWYSLPSGEEGKGTGHLMVNSKEFTNILKGNVQITEMSMTVDGVKYGPIEGYLTNSVIPLS